MTRPPTVPSPDAGSVDQGMERDLTTPCAEPSGGWFPDGRVRLDDQAADRAATFAATLPGYADLWVDQSRSDDEVTNDPNQLILNVRVTQDVAGAEAGLRGVWDGALCVTEAQRSRRELSAILDEVADDQGVLSGSFGFDHVDLAVVVDEDGRLQRRLDARYGRDVVRVTSALRAASPLL